VDLALIVLKCRASNFLPDLFRASRLFREGKLLNVEHLSISNDHIEPKWERGVFILNGRIELQ
jgi:hypothetical protein